MWNMAMANLKYFFGESEKMAAVSAFVLIAIRKIIFGNLKVIV